jgi:hypothetical protein
VDYSELFLEVTAGDPLWESELPHTPEAEAIRSELQAAKEELLELGLAVEDATKPS